MSRQPEPLPHGLEHIEDIDKRLRAALADLQDANRANYPPGVHEPGPLQIQFMEAIDVLLDAEDGLLGVIQAIKAEQRRRLKAGGDQADHAPPLTDA